MRKRIHQNLKTPDVPFALNRTELFFTFLAAYLLLLAWNGYTYGHGDMIELLPYAKWLNNNDLYPQDFFIQNISHQNFNERFILAYLFSLFGNAMPQMALLLHFACGIILLAGLRKIAKQFIHSEALVWAAMLIPFTLLMNTNLGGNEMYIPMMASSTLAKALGIWAVYLFIKKSKDKAEELRQKWYVYTLLSVATIVQPLVGLQLFLILTGTWVLENFFHGEWSFFSNKKETDELDTQSEKAFVKTINSKGDFAKLILPILFYLGTGGLWVFFLQKDFAAGEIDNNLFFEFLEFRLAHHFIPAYFSKKAAVLLLPLFVMSLFFFNKKNKSVFYFFVIALLGMSIFVIGVQFLEIPTVASAQWFKTTIWLKSFSIIAMITFLENKIPFLREVFLQKIGLRILQILGILSIFLIVNPVSVFKNKPYDFFFLERENAAIEISKIAKATTPEDALFIIPASNTFFKTYAERSTYVDYKAVIHRKGIIPVWYDKIQEIYDVNLATRRSGKDIVKVADENLRNLSIEDLQGFSKKGIQYLLTFQGVDLPLERVGENEEFVIYKLM